MSSRVPWKPVLVALVTAGLLYGFGKDLDFPQLWGQVRHARPGWLMLAVVLMLVEWAARGLRWGVVLRVTNPAVRWMDVVSATFAGAALNTVLPLRGGDLARPVVVVRRSGAPFATAITSSFVERVFDLLGMIGVIGLALLWLPEDPGNPLLGALADWARGLVLTAVLALGLMAALAGGVGKGAVQPLLARAPRSWHMVETWERAIQGMSVVSKPRPFAWVLVLTALVWLLTLASLYSTLVSLGISVPAAGVLLTQAALLLAISVPQAPGFLGVFQVVMEKTLLLWGTPPSAAQAMALLYWAVSYVPVSLVGVVAIWREGLDLLRPKRAAAGVLKS